MREWRFKNAFKCNKCPHRNDEDGCPDWWEFTNASGQIVKGCGRHVDIKLPFYIMILHETNCAAASADKATNHAVEAMMAARSARETSATCAALMLGSLMGEIEPVARISGKNGDLQIEAPAGPLD